MKTVKLTEKEFLKCKCPQCPVQEDSTCAKDHLDQMTGRAELDGELTHKKHLPKPALSPALYCSSQVDGSTCLDLDTNKSCMCPTCEVWHNHELGANYYCQNGSADKVG